LRPERNQIEHIARQAASGGRRRRSVVRAGIGDDCAVLRPPAGHDLLVTTDFTLEGVHFRREWYPAAVVGHRCLTRGLSDIAAMGGDPLAAFLSLALPPGLEQAWVDGFFRGLLRLARRFDVPLAGGDLAQSELRQARGTPGRVLADIVVVGAVPSGRAVLRSGARPGDTIYVTGALGGAAALVAELLRGRIRDRKPAGSYQPIPRLEIGRALRHRGLASAMIDLSDGLSIDLDRVCESSGVGAEVDAAAIPRARLRGRMVELETALHGGEDYELLFTAPAGSRVPARIAGVPIRAIGCITGGRKVSLLREGRKSLLRPQGWEYFR
jgi:thiamine-monophosphate kinase